MRFLSMIKKILKILGCLALGILGALIFEVLILPFLLAEPWIEDYPLLKNLSRNVINYPVEKVIIQEGDSLKLAAQQAAETVVVVGKKGEKNGSGFALTSDGLLVLDSSLVPLWADSLWIDGEKTNFKTLVANMPLGLSLIRLEGKKLKTTSLINQDNLEPGEKIFVLKKYFAKVSTTSGAILEENEKPVAVFERTVNEGIIKQGGELWQTNIAEEKGADLSPVFNFRSDFAGMGLTDAQGRFVVIPAAQIRALSER